MPDLLITMLAASEGSSDFVGDLLVILGAAAAVSVLLPRLRLASIPGYLVVGALIGSLGLVSHDASGKPGAVQEISNLSIVLLMFTIGMHLDLDALRSGMVRMLGVGLGSTLGVILLGWPVAMLFGLSAPAALLVSMGISMSSTAVILGILGKQRELHTIHGRLCLGIALVQDLMAVAILALMPLLAVWANGTAAGEVPQAVHNSTMPAWARLLANGLLAVGGIGVMIAFGRYVLPRLLRESGRGGNTEAMLVVSAAAALACAAVTSLLGFGPALGAFLAGFLLSATPFRHQLAGQLAPMRDLFMAIFFTAVGAKMDISAVMQNWWIIALGVGATLSIKALLNNFAAWAGGATAPVAALTAAFLCQAGEFSLVVFEAGAAQNILSQGHLSVAIAVVVLTLMLAGPIVDLARPRVGRLAQVPLAPWFAHSAFRAQTAAHTSHAHAAPAHVAADLNGAAHASTSTDEHAPADASTPPPTAETPAPVRLRVIIAGFGVVGRNLAEHFAAHGIDFIIVETNAQTVSRQIALGREAIFGDVSNRDVLESAGIHTADAVMLTIPDDDATLRACRAIRELRPDIFVAARTAYLSRAIAATELGVDHVTIEEVVTAQDMAVKVIQQLGKRVFAPKLPHL